MTIQIAVLCDAATDYNGKLNLLGTFDTILTSQLPAIHPQCSIALRIAFNRIEEGALVSWVAPAEFIGVHRSEPAGANVLRATLAEALPLGDIALCRFEMEGVRAAVQLHQTTAQLQRGELVVGAPAFLQFDPAGVHIMPRRGLPAPH